MVTTPLRRSTRRRTRQQSYNSTKSTLPKWAQPTSPKYQLDDSPASSVSSVTPASLAITKTVSKISKSSFKWTPAALVHSWHGKLSETYDMINIIGEGRAGAVFIVEHRKNGKHYACKFLKKSDHDLKALRTEVQTLRRLDHPNIVRLHETHEDRETVFLLMELCGGGDLLDKISEEGCLSEHVARVFAQQMLSALAFCHASGVAHRDVKPENFLLETEASDCMTVKLADFGIATSIRPEHLAEPQPSGPTCGSLPYMAPEALEPGCHDAPAAASDLWSCGVTIYAMLSGNLPFGEAAEHISRPPDFSGWRGVSGEAVDLVRRLLQRDSRARLTAQQALAHPWLREDLPATPRSPEFLAEHELALVTLRSLRRWRQLPKLKRIAVAALARRLEGQHEAVRLAESAYALFSGTSAESSLRCEQLAQALHSALLCEALTPEGWGTPGSFCSLTPSPAKGSPRLQRQGSITGLRVRQRVRNALRCFAGSPSCGGGGATLTELRNLVGALDGLKDGAVDYTLLVASLLSPDMSYSEQQIAEVFSLFDTRQRGFVSPGDLQVAVRSGDADLRHYSALIAEFDRNGDGVLDIDEFRAMVQGEAPRDGRVEDPREGGCLPCRPDAELR